MYFFFMCRWWCHVDDDTYVNVPKLLKVLSKYNYKDSVILGKPSLNYPATRTVNSVSVFIHIYLSYFQSLLTQMIYNNQKY